MALCTNTGKVCARMSMNHICHRKQLCCYLFLYTDPFWSPTLPGEAPCECGHKIKQSTNNYIYIYIHEVTFPRPVKSVCCPPGCLPSHGKTGLPTLTAESCADDTQAHHHNGLYSNAVKLAPTMSYQATALSVQTTYIVMLPM